MAILVFYNQDGSIQELEFSAEIRVGAAADNEFRLPENLGAVPNHAIISRSRLYNVPLLIDLAAEAASTRVNGRRVSLLKALQHRDRIELGKNRLEFWEIMVRELTSGSPLIGKNCLVCYNDLRQGDHVVTCPRCQSPHHKECWFYMRTCSYYACGYPVLETMQRVLTPWVRFEKLEKESDLVKKKARCPAGSPRDMGPFNGGERIAYCPGCETPFHAECWFALDMCPTCGYDIPGLIQSIFKPGAAPNPFLQEKIS